MAPRTGRFGSRWLRVDGREVHHRESLGPTLPGTPIVLVHGVSAGLYMVPLGEYLAPYRKVLIPDLPGFGQSWQPPTPFGIGALSASLIAWMDRLGLERAHLVGNSLGCNLAVEAAIERPDLVASVVLQGLTLAPELRTPTRLLSRAALNRVKEFPPPRTMRQAQKSVSLSLSLKGAGDLLKHDLESRLPKLGCPALLVRGTDDPLFPENWVEQAIKLLPSAERAEIEGGTHTLNMFAPEAFAQAVLTFVQQDNLAKNARPVF